MTVLPVVLREMSVLARRKVTYWSRTVTGLLALLVLLWLMLVSRAHVSYATMGSSLFLVLSSICFAFTVLAGMQATSDSVSEEKREGTLGLLFLTDLKGFDVIGGKLAATSLSSVLGLMGVIPMLSLALLLGGVTFQQFALVALVLGNTLFLSLSLGVFVSTLSENERKAMMGTFVGLLVLVVGPGVVAYFLRDAFGNLEEITSLSPLYAFRTLHNRARIAPMVPSYFWVSLAFNHVLAWIFLLLAGWILPRSVNSVPSRRANRISEITQNFVYGRKEDRRKHRAELLDRNAFLWLASRERVKPKYAWGVIAFFVGFHIWIGFQFPNMVFDAPVVAVVMFLLHFIFKVWAASEVCSRLIQDRRSGALELLLSTPLSVKQIADGQTKALGRLFLKPIFFIISLEIFLMFVGFRTFGDMTGQEDKVLIYVVGISTFLLDLWALKWVGLWLSLRGKSIERVLLTTLTRVLAVPWLIFAALMGAVGSLVYMRRSLDETEILLVWWLISVVISVLFGAVARRKFLVQFRELASERFEPAAEVEETKSVKAPVSSNSPKARQPAFYRRHPVTASIFAAVLVIFLLGAIRGFYWERRVEAEFVKIRQRGEPVSMQETLRYAPPATASQNAFAMLDNLGPVMMNTRRQFPARRNQTSITSDELQQFRHLLAANDTTLRAMWRLPEYAAGSFDLAGMGMNVWMQPHVHSGYMAVVDADLMDTIHREGGPDLNRVKKDVLALIAHARLLRAQPVSFAQDKAQEALNRLTGALTFLFEKNLLDDETLVRLQQETERMAGTNMLVRTIAVQRANLIQVSQDPTSIMRMGMPLPKTMALIDTINAGIGTRDEQLAKALRQFGRAMAVAELPIQERVPQAMREELSPNLSWMRIAFYQDNIPSLIWKDASYVANLNVIRAGLAAKRYQRKYGTLPEKLETLVPEFLPAIPEDPYTGGLLRATGGDGFIIYSVGMDRVDNTAPGAQANILGDLRLPVK